MEINMKVIYKANDKLQFELEGSGQKEIFSEEKCGLCGSTSLRFIVRNVEGNDYYELRCNDCGAVLAFGQHKKGGTLFPKRKDDDGNYLPNKGWHKWQPNAASAGK